MFGVVITSFCVVGQLGHFWQSTIVDREVIQLFWNGDELFVAKRVYHKIQQDEISKLPARLQPLFFQKIPINNADIDLLQTVPGIGPNMAWEINKTKIRLGRFNSVNDLLFVHGIGDKKMLLFKDYFSFQ